MVCECGEGSMTIIGKKATGDTLKIVGRAENDVTPWVYGGKTKNDNSFREEFDNILKSMQDISIKKNSDYAEDADKLSNFRLSEQAGVPAWIGSLVRLGDKYSRICMFAKKGTYKVKDESVEDTLIDAANYAIITLILYRQMMRDG